MPLAPDIDLAAAAADPRTEVSLSPSHLLSYNPVARSIASPLLHFPSLWDRFMRLHPWRMRERKEGARCIRDAFEMHKPPNIN